MRYWMTILLSLLILPAAMAGGDLLWIELAPAVSVSGPHYRVGDIAKQVLSQDKKLVARVKQLRVGQSPRMGYSTAVTREELERVIDNKLPGLRGVLHWGGSDTVTIKSLGQSAQTQHFVAYAQETLLADIRQRIDADTEYELAVLSPPKSLHLPQGKLSYKARLPAQVPLNARMMVWLDIAIDGAAYRSLPIWFKVKAEKDVLVFRRAVKERTVLRLRDVRIERRDIAALGGEPAALDADFGQLRTVWHKSKRSVLLQKDLEPLPVVRRQQEVVVRVASGPILIETTGIAKADGKLGDIVKIDNPRGTGSFAAEVVGKGVVYVQ